jgi:hypothetical protein
MEMNTRIQSMLGTASSNPAASGSSQAGPSAKGSVTPAVSAIATNGKLSLEGLSRLAQTLQSVRDELSV